MALPRITPEEYEKQMLVIRNTQTMAIKPPAVQTAVAMAGAATQAMVAQPAQMMSQPAPVTQQAPAMQAAPTTQPNVAPVQSNPAESSQNTTSVIQ